MQEVGAVLADQHVSAIYLVHGTSLDPRADYTQSYAQWFESAIHAPAAPPFRYVYSSGRAKRATWAVRTAR